MKTAIIFSRVSSLGDRQNTERQVLDLQNYAKNTHIEVVEIFEEKISGATKNENRPILQEALNFCIINKIDYILLSELSRLSRNVFEMQETIKFLVENKINLFSEKEQITLLDDKGEASLIVPILISVLGVTAAMERENIKFRLNSGRQQFIEKGGKLGRTVGSTKSTEQKKEEYKDTLSLLKKGYSIRNIAKITKVSPSTIQRLKKVLNL